MFQNPNLRRKIQSRKGRIQSFFFFWNWKTKNWNPNRKKNPIERRNPNIFFFFSDHSPIEKIQSKSNQNPIWQKESKLTEGIQENQDNPKILSKLRRKIQSESKRIREIQPILKSFLDHRSFWKLFQKKRNPIWRRLKIQSVFLGIFLDWVEVVDEKRGLTKREVDIMWGGGGGVLGWMGSKWIDEEKFFRQKV